MVGVGVKHMPKPIQSLSSSKISSLFFRHKKVLSGTLTLIQIVHVYYKFHLCVERYSRTVAI